MKDLSELREELTARVDQAHINKSYGGGVTENCEHERKHFKESIQTENPRFHGTAYFIVLACIKCKDKQRIGFVVEL